jgi:hypothetical protein
MAIYSLDDKRPLVAESAWVADSAQVMGDVVLAANVSVWFGTVIRGDTETIQVGEGSNIQDGSVLHADHGKPLTVGKHVTVGLPGHRRQRISRWFDDHGFACQSGARVKPRTNSGPADVCQKLRSECATLSIGAEKNCLNCINFYLKACPSGGPLCA